MGWVTSVGGEEGCHLRSRLRIRRPNQNIDYPFTSTDAAQSAVFLQQFKKKLLF